MKKHIKGFVAGVLVMALLSATLVFASPAVVREIHYGIGVVLNGRHMQFDEDSQPFIMEGRTFLPLRAMAEMLGLPVEFDAEQNTVHVGYTDISSLLVGRWGSYQYESSHRYPWRGTIDFSDDGTGLIIELNTHTGEEDVTTIFIWSVEGDMLKITRLSLFGEAHDILDFQISILRDIMNGEEFLMMSVPFEGQFVINDVAVRIEND